MLSRVLDWIIVGGCLLVAYVTWRTGHTDLASIWMLLTGHQLSLMRIERKLQ